jgi:galactosylceramidase
LNRNGLSTTKIVAHDNEWDVCSAMAKDPELRGCRCRRCPLSSDNVGPACSTLGKQLWASEDYSMTHTTGANCWARILAQNYARGNLTATIAWNLISSFYSKLPDYDIIDT